MYLKQKQPETLPGTKEQENSVPQKDMSAETKLPVSYFLTARVKSLEET